MIAVRLQGRLGNQLFQYAFIYAASKKLNTKFYLDQYFEKSLIYQYFQIEVNKIESISLFLLGIKGYRNIFNFRMRRAINQGFAYCFRLKKNESSFADEEADVKILDDTLYLGYFQTLLFLEPFKVDIRQKLTLKKDISMAFNERFSSLYLSKTIVTIHIRRSDYKNLSHLDLGKDDLTLPLSYYNNALKELNEKNLHYIFISDDTKFVEENFDHIEPKTISRELEIYDFQHLLNSSICIISNSTFSWWGAWLNAKKNKVVYCPRFYLGFHLKKQIPKNIYPKEWRQIDFN
jgi:hypothetical protein